MPVSGQLTLDDVTRAGMDGMEWGQRQKELKIQQAEAERRRATEQAAEDAFKGVLTQDQADHIARGGKPEDYKPNDSVMLRAADARGFALAKLGDFKGVLQNSAAVEQQRMRIRAQAIQQYGVDKDFGTFAKTFYSTIPDGADVVGYEEVKGGPADAPKGAPSGKDMVRLTIQDRTGKRSSKLVDPEAMFKDAQMMMMDPAKAAEQMVKLDYLTKLEGVRNEGRMTRDAAKSELTLGEIEARGRQTTEAIAARNDGSLAVATVRGQAARDVADKRVSGQITVAQLRAGANGGRGGAASGNNVQSRFTDNDGNVVLVMRNGEYKALVGDDGKPIKSMDYGKRVDRVASDIGKTMAGSMATPQANRDTARKLLESEQKPKVVPAGGSKAIIDKYLGN